MKLLTRQVKKLLQKIIFFAVNACKRSVNLFRNYQNERIVMYYGINQMVIRKEPLAKQEKGKIKKLKHTCLTQVRYYLAAAENKISMIKNVSIKYKQSFLYKRDSMLKVHLIQEH